MRRLLALSSVLAFTAAACASGSNVSTVEADRTGDASGVPVEPDDTTRSTDDPDAGSDPTGPDDEPPSTGSLDWSACEVTTLLPELDCATLRVPRDHARPDDAMIDISLARVPATDPGRRIGSLVFNPGGPGGSGVEFVSLAAAVIPTDVAARFDLVGFDPRGVGQSAAVDCDIDIDDDIALLAPGDDEGWAELVADAMAFPERDCPPSALELAPYVGTNNAARDLDLIRAALGDEGLSYVGYSYGTRLGATYAELFPDRVRALVLDGGVKPTTDFDELDLEQGAGFDRALESFATSCDSDDDCVLRDVGPTLDVIAGLRSDLGESGTLPTDDPERVLTAGELSLGVAAALYAKDAWPFLAEALHSAATAGDGTLLQALGDSLVGREPDGSYDNSSEANLFINCADDPDRPPVDEVRASAELAASQSAHFADFLRASTGCIGIDPAIDPLVVGPATGADPILVIGTTGDPATPYGWSVELAASLDSGVLYTVEGEGHTAYTSIDCVSPVVGAYLIDLDVPAEGSGCTDDEAADLFPPPGESEVDLLLAVLDCLRENGADIPELSLSDLLADPSGEQLVEILDFSDPAFLDAALLCSDLLAEAAGGL